MGWPTASVSGLLVLIVSFAARADPRIVPIRGRDATPAFDFPRTVADAASRARSACLGAIDAAGNLISWEGDDPARPRRCRRRSRMDNRRTSSPRSPSC